MRFLFTCLTLAALAAPAFAADVVGEPTRERYATLKNATQKLVSNTGTGYEPLYGTRNVRAVLNGVYYRGGANNYYHRSHKRANENPLPNDGLQNLCEEGFGEAIYMYPNNFGTAPKSVRCRTYDNADATLAYKQITVLNGAAEQKRVLAAIYEHVRNPRLGPIYVHCWNGWHASGFAAATALRQFCGFTGEQAVNYWNKNTDGVNVGVSYDRIREKIRAFVPYREFSLSAEEQRALCPSPLSLLFSK